MQNTQSQKRSPKSVGHVCSNCGQAVECDLNTDLYEALKEVNLVWAGLDPNLRFPHLGEVVTKALAKAEGK